MVALALKVNGRAHDIAASREASLLHVLRNALGLNGPKYGCGLGQCGACTVQIDGHAVRSCITPVGAVTEARITTLAGLGTPDKPHRIQTAWIEEQVNQCGYCIASHTVSAQKKGMTDAMFKELMAVVGMANETNRLVAGYQVEIDEQFKTGG